MNITIIKWRDIPTQVMIRKSRKDVEKQMLPDRFMEAVDTAAMVSKAIDSDAYLHDWNDEKITVEDGDMKIIIQDKIEQLNSEFTQEILQQYIQNGGHKP